MYVTVSFIDGYKAILTTESHDFSRAFLFTETAVSDANMLGIMLLILRNFNYPAALLPVQAEARYKFLRQRLRRRLCADEISTMARFLFACSLAIAAGTF